MQVWSSDTGTTHNPPLDIVMKGKRWFVAEEMKTTLIDNDDEVSATVFCLFVEDKRSTSATR